MMKTPAKTSGRSTVLNRLKFGPAFPRSPVHVEPILHAKDPRRAEADRDEQDDALEHRLQQRVGEKAERRIGVDDAEAEGDRAQHRDAEDRADRPARVPPSIDVPPMTTAAMEFSV